MGKSRRSADIDILCKRVDRALANLSVNNVVVLANFDSLDDSFMLRIIRYSIHFRRIHTYDNHRVFTCPSDRCDDIVYVPCRRSDKNGDEPLWFIDIRCKAGATPRIGYSSPVLHRFGGFILCQRLQSIGRNSGRFFNTLPFAAACFGFDEEYLRSFGVSPKFYNMRIADIDDLPRVLVNPKISATDIKQIVRNYFKIYVPKVSAFVEVSTDKRLSDK